MNLIEAKLLMESLGDIDAKMPREENAKVINLAQFREIVEASSSLSGTENFRAQFQQNPAFQSNAPAVVANEHGRALIRAAVPFRSYLKTIRAFLDSTPVASVTDSDIFIRLKKVDDLQGLNQQLVTFQKILEQTILDPKVGGKMEVKTVEHGSVILQLYLGSIAAVTLVGGLAWAAAVCYKKYQEARLVEMHVEGLEIKNEALDQIRLAQKQMLKKVVEAEARHLDKEIYGDEEDSERLERVKHAIDLMQGLIEKGAEVHPALTAPENVKNLFPDFKHLENVSSKIKQITEKASG